jgi:hypothetical protein
VCRRSHSTRPSRHLFFFPTLLPHPALSRTARVRARSSKISPFIVVTAPLLRCSTVPLLVAFQPWIRRRTAQKPATAQPTAQCRPPCSPEIPRHRTDPRTIFEPHPFHATSTDCTTSGFGANNPIVYAPDRDQTAATPASTVVPSGSTSTPPRGKSHRLKHSTCGTKDAGSPVVHPPSSSTGDVTRTEGVSASEIHVLSDR